MTVCVIGHEGIVSKRKGSPYRSGRSPDWLKMKNPDAPAVKREAEEDWAKRNGDNVAQDAMCVWHRRIGRIADRRAGSFRGMQKSKEHL
jgi:ATP-dependent DNA ligase